MRVEHTFSAKDVVPDCYTRVAVVHDDEGNVKQIADNLERLDAIGIKTHVFVTLKQVKKLDRRRDLSAKMVSNARIRIYEH